MRQLQFIRNGSAAARKPRQVIDSHCHLADATYADDLEAVVRRADSRVAARDFGSAYLVVQREMPDQA